MEYNGEQWDYERLETEADLSTDRYRDILKELSREKNRILGGNKFMELVQVRDRDSRGIRIRQLCGICIQCGIWA